MDFSCHVLYQYSHCPLHIGPNLGSKPTWCHVTSHDTQRCHMMPNDITWCPITSWCPSSLKCTQILETFIYLFSRIFLFNSSGLPLRYQLQNPPLPTRISRFVPTFARNDLVPRDQWCIAANIGYKTADLNFFPIFLNVDLLAHSVLVTTQRFTLKKWLKVSSWEPFL